MTNFLIPFLNVPQQFSISLAGKDYILFNKWNAAPDAGWVIDIVDSISNLPIVCNIPMVTGIDILAGLEYLNLGGLMIVYTDGNELAVPTLDNLGVESNVYFQTPDAS